MGRKAPNRRGIFFEDISYSADGGLASEMVQNGAFEYSHLDCRDWSDYTCWDKETANGGRAAFAIRDRGSLAPENPHYAVIEVREPDADLINGGFDGMRFAGGASYVLSLWARVDVVDEHSYQSPSWWFHNLDRYDGLDRKGPHVYLGEYGSWGTMLINALSEAAFMAAGMERNGDVVDAPDMSLDGKTYATVDAGLDLAADAYTIDMTVLFHGGSQGFRVRFGDVDGMDSSEVMLGRGQAICVVRDGSAYELASTSWIHSGIPAGTRWRIRIEVADRGRSVRLFRDGELLLEGHEEPLETRRVVSAVLDGLGWTGADRAETDRPGAGRVAVTVLSGDDPYAGTPGTEAPAPVDSIVDLTDGVYHTPAWSLSVIELPVDAGALRAARVHDVTI